MPRERDNSIEELRRFNDWTESGRLLLRLNVNDLCNEHTSKGLQSVAVVRVMSLRRIGIPLEFGSPFFVFLAGDLTGGISPLEEL